MKHYKKRTEYPFDPSKAGFSLLEVLIALSIMAVGFTALLGIQSGHVLLSERTEYMSTAVMLARQKLSDLEVIYRFNSLPQNDTEEIGPIKDEPFKGFPGYGYRLNINKVDIPLPAGLANAEDSENADPNVANSMNTISDYLSQAIREIRLQVFWESAAGEDQIEIVTHFVDLNASFGIQ